MKKLKEMIMSSQRRILPNFGVEFLSMKDTVSLSKKLANKTAENYFPDLIVGIERGGLYPGYCVAEEMQLPYTTIKVSRKETFIGGIETDQIALFWRLSGKAKLEPKVVKPYSYDGYARQVLIVDDDCGSMKTLNLAKSHLEECGLKSKTSVLINAVNCNPDFFSIMQAPISKFGEGNKRFPWLEYSPYFQDYQNWLKHF